MARPTKSARHVAPTIAAILCSAFALLVGAAPAAASELQVTVGGDSGDGICGSSCTLRDALTAANAWPDGDVIGFSTTLTGTIILAQGALPITGPVRIEGPGANLLALNGDTDRTGSPTPADSRIFRIGTAGSVPVAIIGLALRAGYTPGSGGAISTERANLALVDVLLSGNGAGIDGGAIHVAPHGGSLRVERSTVSNNFAVGDGGGISLQGPARGAVVIADSTIAANFAVGDGGGIHSGNFGSRPVEIANSTVAFNHAGGSGGGIFREAVSPPGDGTIGLSSTIVADNSAARGDGIADAGSARGEFKAGFSLIEDASGAKLVTVPVNSNQAGVDAGLRPLALRGGSMPTVIPLPDSTALDAGIGNGLTVDQRGYARTTEIRDLDDAPGSDGTDIGAAELRAPRVRFRGGPHNTIRRRNVRIKFDSEAQGTTFYCSFDFSQYVECTSPLRARRLDDGYHQLKVRAETDDAILGRAGRRGFVVDTELKRPKAWAKEVQRIRGRRIKVRVDAVAKEDVVIKARGFIKLRGGGRVPLRRQKVAIPARRVKRFNLRPRSKRSNRRLVGALRRRDSLQAKVDVIIVDRGEHRFKERFKVELKRKHHGRRHGKRRGRRR